MLLLLLLLPAFIWLYIIYAKRRKEAILKFSSVYALKTAGGKTGFRRLLPYLLMMLSLTLMILALADPYIPLNEVKEGVNVVLVIDDSGSMAANDYEPTRLEAAKKSAELLIKSLKDKDNVGIVVFESGASTAAYLTPYKDKAVDRLRAIQQREGRTAIGDGLALAVDMATSIPNKKRVIILLSDGVNNAGSVSPEDAIILAKKNNIQVHTVAMGSDKQVILGYDIFGNPSYAEPVDEATLQRIASETGGTYRKSVDSKTLDEIYRNIGEELEREWENTSIKNWFIMAALIVTAVNMYVIYGKYRIVV